MKIRINVLADESMITACCDQLHHYTTEHFEDVRGWPYCPFCGVPTVTERIARIQRQSEAEGSRLGDKEFVDCSREYLLEYIDHLNKIIRDERGRGRKTPEPNESAPPGPNARDPLAQFDRWGLRSAVQEMIRLCYNKPNYSETCTQDACLFRKFCNPEFMES